jgi:DNA-binding MarR family transcriptional regulator
MSPAAPLCCVSRLSWLIWRGHCVRQFAFDSNGSSLEERHIAAAHLGHDTAAVRRTMQRACPVVDQLDYFVPFLLYRIVAKGIRRATADYAKLDLAIQEARVLIAVAQHGKIRVGALADLTCIEQSALSHMLRGLSRRNLVKRDRVQYDNRSVDVGLTTEGSKLARVCLELSKEHEEAMLKSFSAQDQRVIRRYLKAMYENVAEWTDGGILTIAHGRRKK